MAKPFSCPRKQKRSKPLNPMVYPLPPNYHFQKRKEGKGPSLKGSGRGGRPTLLSLKSINRSYWDSSHHIWTLHAK